ncbi:tetratricopeptide repeat protein [Gracilimonas sp.]|uniref:tetratricopeptide repeat protein n=1 Tax=Gracilimonas sp. TaxID=1974203 RepID=UPI002871CCDD|nr:hypothetical protein [Gracilimonas sp.]
MTIPDFTKAQDSPSIDSLTSKASVYFDEAREEKALKTYLSVLNQKPQNFEALWHTSLLYARIGFRMNSKKEMEDYYNESLSYAEKTLKLYPDRGYTHFVYAIAQGRLSDISGASKRIEKSHIIKKHAIKATELLPDYAPAWHLRGIWNSEVANISSAERFAAGVFSQGIPEDASNEKAEEYIKKAIELNPEQVIRFKLDLARHYNRSGQKEKAIEALKEVVQENPRNPIDEWNMERAKQLLKELS